MSEYQYVAFRAIDGPVSQADLDFMERQSSRAEVTPWSFDNEYHYGSFRGDANAMLRRGYDIHLHYANFGTRTLMIRFPAGLPNTAVSKNYLRKDGVVFSRDKDGPGGILCIDPFIEAGEREDLCDIPEMLDRLIPLRAEIMDGDLRPLYLAHLAMACDGNHDPDEIHDAPIPAGLDKLTEAQEALAELYGLEAELLAAAAKGGPSLAKREDSKALYAAWIRKQSVTKKNAWLARLMTDPPAAVRTDVIAEFRKHNPAPEWPTLDTHRTITELRAVAEATGRNGAGKNSEMAAKKRPK